MSGRTLYDTDILAWTEEQAAALRALAGRPDLPNVLDLANVIEEIEALGRTELRAAITPLRQMLRSLLTLAFLPDAAEGQHGSADIIGLHGDMLEAMTPSMHGRMDMDALWQRARRIAAATLAETGLTLPAALPPACPFDLTDFLGEEFDTDTAIVRLRALIPA